MQKTTTNNQQLTIVIKDVEFRHPFSLCIIEGTRKEAEMIKNIFRKSIKKGGLKNV